MRESQVAPTDRRQSPRMKLSEIAYIGMGPENGGLILDVSDGGLSFHAVAPVQPAQRIHFQLSLRGRDRIEGGGVVVWTNEMRTVCGLRFTSLSTGAREHLNSWTNQSRIPEAAREKAVSPLSSTIPQMDEPPASDASPLEANPDPIFAIPPADKIYLSEPMSRRKRWRQLFLIVLGITGTALLGAVYLYGLHVGESEIESATRSAAVSKSQASPLTTTPAPVPASPVPNEAPSVASETPSVPSQATATLGGSTVNAANAANNSTSAEQRTDAAGHSAASHEQQAEQTKEAGRSELAAAMSYLNGDHGTRDSTKAVRLLWAAVGNGNSAAEVVLADLYVNGDGVAKNCEQGQVLLIAAAKSGYAQAKVKLDELKTKGCP
jgi:PilZ domain